MPDSLDEPVHVLAREVAQSGPWRQQLADKARMRDALPTPGGYYDALRPLCSRLEVWHTIYNHVLEDAAAVVEWVKGTGLRPFLDPLEAPERKEYLRNIPGALPPPIRRRSTARYCCASRGFSSWR